MNHRYLPTYVTSVLYTCVATLPARYLYGHFTRLGSRTPR